MTRPHVVRPTIMEMIGVIALILGPMIGWVGNEITHRDKNEKMMEAVAVALEAEFKSLERDAIELNKAQEAFSTTLTVLCTFPFTLQNIQYLQNRGEIQEICR